MRYFHPKEVSVQSTALKQRQLEYGTKNIAKLRNNVAEPVLGMPLRAAYTFQLPDIRHL